MRREITMEKHATVRYGHSTRSNATRYVHKYYLPQELKSRILPVDIDGIEICLMDDAECNFWEQRIPEHPPACVIHYEDIGLEKRIEGDTIRRVLEAYAAYRGDRRTELTPGETRTALNLNAWLIDWEEQLLARCIQLSEDMERRVRAVDLWLTDYEIDLELGFYVRADDQFSEDNNPGASIDDVDCDIALLCETRHLCSALSTSEASKEDYWGIGDRRDYNARPGLSDNPIYQVRHCLTFHELYDHLTIPMKHMGRIGRVFADIVVRHQNGTWVDLTGERAVAVRDSPRIRESIVLRGE